MSPAEIVEWWSEHPGDHLWDVPEITRGANDNGRRLVALAETFPERPDKDAINEDLSFPLARGAPASTRQGEAQLAQAQRAEQAGGWGLTPFTYDVVGNPVEIRDWRDAADWPAGAKPVTKKIAYDDLYRAVDVRYEYAGGDDEWTSPFAAEVAPEANQSGGTDPRRATPSPHVDFSRRILRQSFEYDWLGNNERTSDDAGGFYDRSLGEIDSDHAGGKPYQLRSADLPQGAGVTSAGHLEARYDAAGAMTALVLERSGACLAAGSTDPNACNQRFDYQWDEVGRLSRARRWDASLGADPEQTPLPTTAPQADLRYAYDASDQRVIKHAVDEAGEESFTLYVFETLEIRRTSLTDSATSGGGSPSAPDYAANHYTVVPYLLANGVRLGRVAYEAGESPKGAQTPGEAGHVSQHPAANNGLHIFFELGDHLGSTSVVLDKATGELVERASYQAYGGAESDYRPSRWQSFREDYRFTGKEGDVEVGLQYFGKRYLNPLLGRWMSADPLAVHAPGEADLNLYAYVSGAVLKNVDPLGLEETEASGAGGASSTSSPGTTEGGGHEGAPSTGGVEQGGEWDPTVRKYVEAGATATLMLATAGTGGGLAAGLALMVAGGGQATGDTPCSGADCDGRAESSAAFGLVAAGVQGAAVTTAAVGRAAAASRATAQAAPGAKQSLDAKAMIRRDLEARGEWSEASNHATKGGLKFTQTTASAVFKNGSFAGRTIGDVATGLRSGAINPSQLPIDVVVRNGETLALNTRSLLALRRGGVDPSRFVINNRTGNSFFENLLTQRLGHNGLAGGTDTLRITGLGQGASSLR